MSVCVTNTPVKTSDPDHFGDPHQGWDVLYFFYLQVAFGWRHFYPDMTQDIEIYTADIHIKLLAINHKEIDF